VFTLLFCPQISQAIESRKIEKLIDGAQSPIEKKTTNSRKRINSNAGQRILF